jgi:hypothetical protein
MRLVCYMDSGGKRSMWEAPGCAVHRGLAHSERTGADREMEDMGWSVAAAEEELAADGAVDVQCSRVAVVGCGAEVEDPAARGGDDALRKAKTRRDVYFDTSDVRKSEVNP